MFVRNAEVLQKYANDPVQIFGSLLEGDFLSKFTGVMGVALPASMCPHGLAHLKTKTTKTTFHVGGSAARLSKWEDRDKTSGTPFIMV